MKKAAVVAAGLLLSVSILYAQHFWRGPLMSNDEVGKKWGQSVLNVEEFKNGKESNRAAMAFSLLAKQKEFVGLSVEAVRKTFGDPDGFYFSDIFPAYIIQRAKSTKEEAWQVVFLLDKAYKVEKIVVHKSCCDQVK